MRLALGKRFERMLLVFVVCVPVPALALSGLAIPLPGVVDRIGAALVPWANAATLDEASLVASTTRGKIVLAPGSTGTVDAHDVAAAEPTRARPASAQPRRNTPIAGFATSSSPGVPSDSPEPQTSPPAPEEPAPSPAPEPTPQPAPAPPTEPSAPPSDPAPSPPTNTDPPTADPVPDREPIKPDVKPEPVDPDVKPTPTNDTDVLPPEPTPEPEPDVRPDLRPGDGFADPSNDKT